MRHRYIAVALAMAILSPAATAATMVREVEVTVDMAAIDNPKAAARWGHISDDLRGAIIARLAGLTAPDGARITIDMDEVALANGLELATNIADSRLVGSVKITSETDNTVFDAYDLTVTHDQALPFFLEGTDLTRLTSDSMENYQAMVQAFAAHVVDNLK